LDLPEAGQDPPDLKERREIKVTKAIRATSALPGDRDRPVPAVQKETMAEWPGPRGQQAQTA
jgi:hypothetical protein